MLMIQCHKFSFIWTSNTNIYGHPFIHSLQWNAPPAFKAWITYYEERLLKLAPTNNSQKKKFLRFSTHANLCTAIGIEVLSSSLLVCPQQALTQTSTILFQGNNHKTISTLYGLMHRGDVSARFCFHHPIIIRMPCHSLSQADKAKLTCIANEYNIEPVNQVSCERAMWLEHKYSCLHITKLSTLVGNLMRAYLPTVVAHCALH